VKPKTAFIHVHVGPNMLDQLSFVDDVAGTFRE
jgi:hypothetical protein